MFKKNLDLIAEKKAQYAELAQQSTSAYDLVTNTINQLNTISEQMDVKVGEIDAAMAELANTKAQFETASGRNRKIADNFKQLIEVE